MERITRRYPFIDVLRGIAVLSMVIFHFIWDVYYVAGSEWSSLSSIYNFLWQQSICWTFILISGFCYRGSRHPLKNGMITLLGGVAVTVVTCLVTPDAAIYFGVLSFLGAAMLMLLPIRRYLCKIPPIVGMALSFTIFLFCYSIDRGSLCFGLIELPRVLYKNMLTAFLGFPPRGFSSSDYFSVLPWIFLYLTGYFVAGLIRDIKPPRFLFWRCGIFEWIGRHALIIYLAHQPVIYGLTLALDRTGVI